MKVVAIDPGLDGALAYIETRNDAILNVSVIDMPTIKLPGKRIVDGALVARYLRTWFPDTCVVEQVASRPKQGVVSVFSFGRALGTVEGVIHACDIPLERVVPRVWQQGTGVLGVADPRGRAAELIPRTRKVLEQKKDIGRADALLIAYWWTMVKYGSRTVKAESAPVW